VKSSYTIIGLMSGTSMDGLDIAFSKYEQTTNNKWQLTVYQTETDIYPKNMLENLKNSTCFSASQLLDLDKKLGHYFAEKVNAFILRNKIDKKSIDAIASHGHTIFHQPDKGYTYQIGCGSTLAFNTELKVINDFRQKDVIAGGQGAPLVPIGDKLLFHQESSCFLNLGGFANCCILKNKNVIAYDICPANLPLNQIMNRLGLEYDKDGKNAREGKVDLIALEKLNALSFYQQNSPKSLGTEWLTAEFNPVITEIINNKDKLRTIIEHIAIQIGENLIDSQSIYITGGGVRNTFLLERIAFHFEGEIVIPSEQIVDYKEAIIFGFLGALHLSGIPNTLASVTGANKDVIGGVLHRP